MVDTVRSLNFVDRERLPIGGTFSMTFRIFGKAPLVFLTFGLLSQTVVLGRLLVGPPIKPGFDLPAAMVLVGTFLTSFLFHAAAISSALRLYNGEPASAGEALALGMRRYLTVGGTTLLYILASDVGLLLLIVPGVILKLIFAVGVEVSALEGAAPIAALKRSGFLTKGERWRILGIYCPFFIPLMIVSGIIVVTLSIHGRLVASQLCTAAVQLVWMPLAAIFSTVIYAELRRLKETVGVARIFD